MGDILQPGTVIKPVVSASLAESLLVRLYGLRSTTVKELNSYDDRNFRFTVEMETTNPHIREVCQDGYILKVTNWQDSKDVDFFDAQNEMILHMAGAGLDVPVPIANCQGKLKSTEELEVNPGVEGTEVTRNVVRLLKFVPGSILDQIQPWTRKHFYQCGAFVAKMDVALQSFHHPAYLTRNSIWFLSSIPAVRQFVSAVEDPERNKMIHEILDCFCDTVIPIQDKLEAGIIHGDFNEQNILMRKNNDEDSVYSVIDFGDSQHGPLLYELAITIMYMMTKAEDPNMVGGHVLAGYLQHRHLPHEERKLIRVCVAARYAQSLSMGAYSYKQDPGNEYLLITAKTGWKTLSSFWQLSQRELYAGWDKVLEDYDDKYRGYLTAAI